MDFKSAYLNSEVDYEIFMNQPVSTELGENGEKLLCKLNKSLYGLKQSGRNWNLISKIFLLGKNFEQSLADNCIFTLSDENGRVIMIVWVEEALCCNFQMKDLGILKHFLGMHFSFDDSCNAAVLPWISELLSKICWKNSAWQTVTLNWFFVMSMSIRQRINLGRINLCDVNVNTIFFLRVSRTPRSKALSWDYRKTYLCHV